MMYLKKYVMVHMLPIGPSEECVVPKDPEYPLCAEKVKVTICGSMCALLLLY